MQTASKIEIDNWSDINGQNIMNIRPVGTYTKPCHCKPHHKPCWPHHKPCWPPYNPWFPPIHEVHNHKPECDCHHKPECDCYHKPECDCHHKPECDCYHKPECDCYHKPECNCHHIPVDVQPLPPHFYPVDIDGDGFVENDIIVKPIPHHHCHPVHPVPPCYCSENVEENVEETVNEPEESQMIPEGTYGSIMAQTVVQEDDTNVEPIEEPIEEPTLNELDDVLTDVWSNSQVVDTETNEIVSEQTQDDTELHEVEEPIKPARVRRVNRGGRRKKED